MASEHAEQNCPYGSMRDEHIGPCEECGEVRHLGWSHLCLPCWEAHVRDEYGRTG